MSLKLFQKLFISLVVFSAAFLLLKGGFVFAVDPVTDVNNFQQVPILSEAEKLGGCPTPLPGDIAVCGKVKTVSQQNVSGSQSTALPIGGVFIVTYQTNEAGKLKDPSTFTLTNKDGEYYINIHKMSGKAGYEYLAFLCPNGSSLKLKDMYAISSFLKNNVGVLDVGINCSSQEPNMDLRPPLELDFVDRSSAFLSCGEGLTDWRATAASPLSSTATIPVTVPDADRRFNWDFTGKTFNPIDWFTLGPSSLLGQIPDKLLMYSNAFFEGRHKAELAEDPYGIYSFINSMVVGYQPERVRTQGDSSLPLPSCKQIQESNTTVTDSGINSYVAGGPAVGLAPPGTWESMIKTIDPDLLKNTGVCLKEDGTAKTLDQFKIGDPDYPYKLLFQLTGDKNLSTQYAESKLEYKAINDQGANSDDSSDSLCREVLFSKDDIQNQGTAPFKACSTTRHQGVSAGLRYTGTLGEGVGVDYVPTYLLAAPFEKVDKTNSSIKKPSGIYRIGLPKIQCDISTINQAPTPNLALENYNPVISGYKVVGRGTNPGTDEIGAGAGPSISTSFYQDDQISQATILNFLANLVASFQVVIGNVINDITNSQQCTALDTSVPPVEKTGVVAQAECAKYGEPICIPHEEKECVWMVAAPFPTVPEPCSATEEGTTKAYGSFTATCTCTTTQYYSFYESWKYTCDGSVGYPLSVKADIIENPGDEVKASSQYFYQTLGAPFATVPYSVGSWSFSDQSVTSADSNIPGEAADLTNSQGTNSGATYGDLTRFTTQPDYYNSSLLINPREYPHAENDFGSFVDACDGSLFENIPGMKEEFPAEGVYSSGGENALTEYAQMLNVFRSYPNVVEAYAQAQSLTGVPCEILAGIHHMEGSSYPNARLQDGAPIDPGLLTESAIWAANHLIGKLGGKDIRDWNAHDYIIALSRYNGGGNSNCNSRCGPTPWCAANGGSRLFEGEDDIYPVNWLDSTRHFNMYLWFESDGQCMSSPELFKRAGALPMAILFHRDIMGGDEAAF